MLDQRSRTFFPPVCLGTLVRFGLFGRAAMKLILTAYLTLILAIGLASSHAQAYQEAPVKNGGSITGLATLKGPVPAPRVFLLSLSPFGEYCKKISDGEGRIVLEEFTVGKEGGMRDVVVAVQDVTSGKPFAPITGRFEATDCMFHPSDVPASELYTTDEHGHTQHIHPMVGVIENHRPISVVNRDPIFHNGQVFQRERGNIMLNFPLPVSGKPRGGVLNFDRGLKIGEMICGMHEFMQTWGFVVDNPYYAKTESDGRFGIDQLPPGTYRILAWHPHFKPIERIVEVPPGGSVSVNFEFDASKIKRRTFESDKGLRMFR
jgi:Carboxypeptidase regulatory-like domain